MNFKRYGNTLRDLSGSHTWFLMDLKDRIVIQNMLFMIGCEQLQVKKIILNTNVESRYDGIYVFRRGENK